jgi:hypothetical protein
MGRREFLCYFDFIRGHEFIFGWPVSLIWARDPVADGKFSLSDEA